MAIERLAPDSILASQDLSGTVADIDDDPDSPDGAWLTAPGSNTETSVRVSFPSPSGTLDGTANAQEIRALVRKTNHSSNPFATLYLYENGSQVKILQAETSISSTTGQIFSGTFSASEINNPANVEVFIEAFVGGGSPSNRASMEVGAIEWNATTTGSSTNADAEVSPVGGAAHSPGGSVKPVVGLASSTATAEDATVTVGSKAFAAAATVGVSASNTTSKVSTTSEAVAVGGVAGNTNQKIISSGSLASVSAVALSATVQTEGGDNPIAQPEVASVVAFIPDDRANVRARAGIP